MRRTNSASTLAGLRACRYQPRPSYTYACLAISLSLASSKARQHHRLVSSPPLSLSLSPIWSPDPLLSDLWPSELVVPMGNTPSCIPLAPAGGCASTSSAAATKVIHADGTVTRLARPVRASELMLDHPGQFVCDSARLAVGCRVPGVGADELLLPRHAYFLLPMDMLYSVLTEDEMAALSDSHAATAAASSWKRITTAAAHRNRHDRRAEAKDGCSDGGRVYPMVGLLEAGDLGAPDSNKPELLRAGAASKSTAGGGAVLRRHRSWQPVLDTIEEVP